MTNQQLLDIFNTGNAKSFATGLRTVWNAGWYEGKGTTPTTTTPDKSFDASKPVAVSSILNTSKPGKP